VECKDTKRLSTGIVNPKAHVKVNYILSELSGKLQFYNGDNLRKFNRAVTVVKLNVGMLTIQVQILYESNLLRLF